MTKDEIIASFKELGNAGIRDIYIRHGAKGELYGVKIQDMKPFQKIIKKNYELAKELFDSGISDAMYFAGLIADEKKMTKEDLQYWAENASWYMISEYTVPWVTAESKFAYELALEWIESEDKKIAVSGWSVLANLCSIKDYNKLDIDKYSELLDLVAEKIHSSPNRVRYAMNSFIISTGIYIVPLRKKAIETAEKVGKVDVYLGKTACKVPYAQQYIEIAVQKNPIPKLKKTCRC